MKTERDSDNAAAKKEGPVPAHLRWTFLEDEAAKSGLIVRNPAPGAAALLAAPYVVINQK